MINLYDKKRELIFKNPLLIVFKIFVIFSIILSILLLSSKNIKAEIQINLGYDDKEALLIKNNYDNKELILMQDSKEIQKTQNTQEIKHSFEVNIYYPNKTDERKEENKEYLKTAIKIEPILTNQEILQCNEANFSFKLTNPSSNKEMYSFKIKNFKGSAFMTQNLVLNPNEYRIIKLKLVPDCKDIGNFNPFVVVETNKEEALLSLQIKIISTNIVDENNCEFYYDSELCQSAFYIKLKKNSIYKIDLSKWFYDPDGDKLTFTSNNPDNFEIIIKKNIAYIKPNKNWYGAKEIAFTAEDSKGGKTTKVFYFHVLNQEKTFWEKVLSIFEYF
ncbi:MAG: hypothetical protein QXE31_04725 [Candidatus Woesearchaeota archaeon]